MDFIDNECMYSLKDLTHPSENGVVYLRLSVDPLTESESHPYFYFTDARFFIKSLEHFLEKKNILSVIILDRHNENIPFTHSDECTPLSEECKSLFRKQFSPNNDIIFVLKV